MEINSICATEKKHAAGISKATEIELASHDKEIQDHPGLQSNLQSPLFLATIIPHIILPITPVILRIKPTIISPIICCIRVGMISARGTMIWITEQRRGKMGPVICEQTL